MEESFLSASTTGLEPSQAALKLPDREVRVLMHTLTGSSDKRKAYRNYYAAGNGHHSINELRSLVGKGLMEVGGPFGDNGHYYHCTEAGARAVGLELPRD